MAFRLYASAMARYGLPCARSICLPIGSTQRLANPGKIDLELIEVQTGNISERMTSSESTMSIIENEAMAAP